MKSVTRYSEECWHPLDLFSRFFLKRELCCCCYYTAAALKAFVGGFILRNLSGSGSLGWNKIKSLVIGEAVHLWKSFVADKDVTLLLLIHTSFRPRVYCCLLINVTKACLGSFIWRWNGHYLTWRSQTPSDVHESRFKWQMCFHNNKGSLWHLWSISLW